MKRRTLIALGLSVTLLSSLAYALGLPSLVWNNASQTTDYSDNPVMAAADGKVSVFRWQQIAPNQIMAFRLNGDNSVAYSSNFVPASISDAISAIPAADGGNYVSMPKGPPNPRVFKVSASGALLWNYEDTNDGHTGPLAADAAGDPVMLAMAGPFPFKYTLLTFNPAGGALTAGVASGNQSGSPDFYNSSPGLLRTKAGNWAGAYTRQIGAVYTTDLVRFDSSKDFAGTTTSTDDPFRAYGIAEDKDANLWIAGQRSLGGTITAGVLWKLSAAGVSLSAKTYIPGPAGMALLSPIADPDGGILALHAGTGRCTTCPQASIVKFDANGDFVSSMNVFDTATQAVQMTTDCSGNIFVLGTNRNGGAAGKVNVNKYSWSTGTCSGAGKSGPSGIGKSRLAPVPLKKGDPLCLYYSEPVSTTKWEVFAEDQTRIATLDFGAGDNLCWSNTNSLPTGVYFIKVSTKYVSGTTEERIQKITVVNK